MGGAVPPLPQYAFWYQISTSYQFSLQYLPAMIVVNCVRMAFLLPDFYKLPLPVAVFTSRDSGKLC
jgi:hypothetical protein